MASVASADPPPLDSLPVKELTVAAKVQAVIEMATRALADGFAVVIGLQTTGEAGLDRVIAQIQSGQTSKLTSFVSTAHQSLLNFIETQFPTTVAPPKDIARGQAAQQEAMGVGGGADWGGPAGGGGGQQLVAPPPAPAPVAFVDAESARLKEEMLTLANALTGLPAAPLDALIDGLGGVGAVAEMTGRSGRVGRVAAGGGVQLR